MADIYVGATFLALSLFSFFSAARFQTTLIQDTGLGAAFFPQFVSVVMAIVALVVLVRALARKPHVRAPSVPIRVAFAVFSLVAFYFWHR